MFIFFLRLERAIIVLLPGKVCANIVFFYLSRSEIWIAGMSRDLLECF